MNYTFNSILLINDQDSMMKLVENSVKDTGIEVKQLKSLRLCETLLHKTMPDVMLFNLPFDDDTAYQIQNISKQWPNLSIILLSKDCHDIRAYSVFENSFAGLVQMPFLPLELLMNIQFIVSAYKVRSKHQKALRMKQLSQSYEKHLLAIKPKLEQMWQQVQSKSQPSKYAINSLLRESHKIAGTAGTYGMLTISETAVRLEDQLINFEESGFTQVEELIAQGEPVLKEVLELIEQLAS